MKAASHFSIHAALWLTVPLLAQCRKDSEGAAGDQREAPLVSASAPPAAPPAPVTEPLLPAASSQIPAEPPPNADLGDWVDARPYRFKVSGIRRCGEAKPAPDAKAEEYRLGIFVEVFSKYDELVVSSRDVKLESGGIILLSEIDPKPSPGCAAPLVARQLRRDQTASGVVVFTVPPEFDARSAVVVYQATRWGGSPRVEFKIPACFDACPPRKPAQR